MKKHIRKIMSIAMLAIILANFLSGCGSDGNTSEKECNT